MKTIEFIPLKGVVINSDQKIEFGMSKNTLLNTLGQPTQVFDRELYFEELELRVDLDKNDSVEFIESLMGPLSNKTQVSINAINPFATKSDELVDILSSLNNGKIDQSEAEYGYTFIDKAIGVYRESTVEDIEGVIEKLKALNEFEDQKEDVLFELEKSKYFWTLGIGKVGYYDFLREP